MGLFLFGVSIVDCGSGVDWLIVIFFVIFIRRYMGILILDMGYIVIWCFWRSLICFGDEKMIDGNGFSFVEFCCCSEDILIFDMS